MCTNELVLSCRGNQSLNLNVLILMQIQVYSLIVGYEKCIKIGYFLLKASSYNGARKRWMHPKENNDSTENLGNLFL